MFRSGQSVVVGVSGGPDSLCLLDILVTIAHTYGLRLHIAHINYRLRGADSDRDEQLVRARASAYGLPCFVAKPKFHSQKGNLEEQLRDLRYAFFERVRLRTQSDSIAVAHNQNDQAETLLMRLLRGSGLQGLSAIQPHTGTVVRPLIETKRSDILRYLKERTLSFRTDASNRDLRFLRNRIRHRLIPLLERDYQKNIQPVLATTATLVSNDYALIQSLVPQVLPNGSGYSVQALLNLPLPVLRLHLRHILKPLSDTHPPSKGLVEEILKILKSTKSKSQRLQTKRLKIIRKGDRLTFTLLPH